MARRVGIGDGMRLAYEDSGGDGPAVLFLHGLGGSSNGWLAQLEACRRRGWRGVAPDQRGAGRSDSPPGPYSIDLWAQDAEGILDALGIAEAAVVGHSVGCMIAVRAAQRLAGRCWALALCGGIADWPPAAEETFAQRAQLALQGRGDEIAEAVAAAGLSERCRREDPRLLGLMREAIASCNGDTYALWAEATAKGRMQGLEELAPPLLAFCGSEDPVTPPAASQAIAQAAPSGVAATVEGAAHWCMLEAPEATEKALFAFLESHAPAA